MSERIGILILLILLLAFPAAAEMPAQDVLDHLLPGAEVEYTFNGRCEAVLPETGERVQIICDASGAVVRLETLQPAPAGAFSGLPDRSAAEAAVHAVYPDCRILFAEDTDGGKRLAVADADFCGAITVAQSGIISRGLEMGEIYRDDLLTYDGAEKLLALHRPQATLLELEFDEDDGLLIYEGEALLTGTEYEFEMDARSGKLLEWERD